MQAAFPLLGLSLLLVVYKLVPSRISYQALFYVLIGSSSLLISVTPFLCIYEMRSRNLRASLEKGRVPQYKADLDGLASAAGLAQRGARKLRALNPRAVLGVVSKLKLVVNYFIYEDIILFLTFNLVIKKYRSGMNSLRTLAKMGTA